MGLSGSSQILTEAIGERENNDAPQRQPFHTPVVCIAFVVLEDLWEGDNF